MGKLRNKGRRSICPRAYLSRTQREKSGCASSTAASLFVTAAHAKIAVAAVWALEASSKPYIDGKLELSEINMLHAAKSYVIGG